MLISRPRDLVLTKRALSVRSIAHQIWSLQVLDASSGQRPTGQSMLCLMITITSTQQSLALDYFSESRLGKDILMIHACRGHHILIEVPTRSPGQQSLRYPSQARSQTILTLQTDLKTAAMSAKQVPLNSKISANQIPNVGPIPMSSKTITKMIKT